MTPQTFRSSVALAAAIVLLPALAAAERKNPLDDQPAVRHRLLLVKHRLELAPAFEASVNADFKHTLSGGLKLEYHLSDMWSLGAIGFFGTGLNTGLNSRIVDTLPDEDPATDPEGDDEPTPTRQEWEQHLNTIPLHGAAYLSITPWYGKMAAFGKFFVNFDFYFQGGLAFAQLKNTCCSFPHLGENEGVIEEGGRPDGNPNDDEALNDGTRLGLYLGGGVHIFMSDWIALDLTVRDYLFADNPSGLDFDADLVVTEDDQRFLGHLFMGVGISLFLPSTVKRTP